MTGQLETPDAGVTYIMDVLEEVGGDAARRCFWDFGDWSDLWRETKHVPLDVSLQVSSWQSAGKHPFVWQWVGHEVFAPIHQLCQLLTGLYR